MKRFLLSVILLTLIVTLCSGLLGCSNELANDNQGNISDDTQESITTDAPLLNNTNSDDLNNSEATQMDYTLVEQSGKNYLVFDNINDYDNSGLTQLASLDFDSLAELKNVVTNGKLEDWQKNVVATSFEKDETGILICDFNKLLEPVMPGDCKLNGVNWSGETYSFYVSTESEIFGFFHYYTEDVYRRIYDREFENFFNRTNITVKGSYETSDGKIVTNFLTFAGDFMNIRYTYSAEDKTIIVDETYRLSMVDESLATSSTVPSNIVLFIEEPDAYYRVDLYGFVEKPSESWLYEFGMKPYVDRDAAEK